MEIIITPEPDYKASFWGIKCYAREDGEDLLLWGTTQTGHHLLSAAIRAHDIMTWLTQIVVPDFEGEYPLEILEDYQGGEDGS